MGESGAAKNEARLLMFKCQDIEAIRASGTERGAKEQKKNELRRK